MKIREEDAMEGSQQKMREALVEIRDMIMGGGFYERSLAHIVNICDAALAAPPRNCDVGTTKEQEARWNDYCDDVTRGDCPPSAGCRSCALYWGQMPYEAREGGADNGSGCGSKEVEK